jgi:Ribbon-helix-helix protein, copG family.
MQAVKISDEVYSKVKELAEKMGKSIREIVEEAINIYILGKSEAVDKDIKNVKEKWIVAKFQSKCAKCGKQINQGDMAYWIHIEYVDGSKRSIIYCVDCYYTSIDSTLAKRYLKLKELEATVRGLKKEADRLAEEIKQLEQTTNLLRLEQDIEKFWYDFKSTFIDNPSVDVVKNFIDRMREIIDRVEALEKQLRVKIVERYERKVKKGEKVEVREV